MFSTYILYSAKTQKYYVGQTEALSDRIQRHNDGESKSTKAGVPWELIWEFQHKTRGEAILLENKIKKRGAKRFLEDNTIRGVAQPG